MSIADGIGSIFGLTWFGGGGSSSPPRPQTADEWASLWVRGEPTPVASTPPISAVGPIATDYINPNAGVPRATPVPPGPTPSAPSARGPATPGTFPEVWRGPGGSAPIGGVPAGLATLIGRFGLFGILMPSDVADATRLPKGQTKAKKRQRGDRLPPAPARPVYAIPRAVGWRPPVPSNEPSMLDVMDEEDAHRAALFQQMMDRRGKAPEPFKPARSRPRGSPAPVRTASRGPAPTISAGDLTEIHPTARRLPVSVPAAVPRASTSPPRSAPAKSPWKLPGIGIPDLAQWLLPIALTRAGRGRTALPFAQPGFSSPSAPPLVTTTPSTPSYTDPLTPVQPIGAAYPLTGSGWQPPSNIGGGSLTDQCRALNRRRKPKRKCVERDDCNKCIRYQPI